MTSRRRLRGEAGITLVELLTGTTVSAVVLAVVAGTVIGALRTQRRQTAQVAALNDANLALERTTRDVRAADPLRLAHSDRIQLDVLDSDGTRRTVSYERSEDALVFAEATGERRTLVTGLMPAQPLFVFHLSDGTIASGDAAISPQLVRAVTIRLIVETAAAGRVVDLENYVVLRNAM